MQHFIAIIACFVALSLNSQVERVLVNGTEAHTSLNLLELESIIETLQIEVAALQAQQALATGPAGPEGPAGPAGPAGADGSNGIDNISIGAILPFAGEQVPAGWLICDGRELLIQDYEDLYQTLGTTYGVGESTFKIPDLRGRTIIGDDDMGTLGAAGIVLQNGNQLGSMGGAETHQLTEDELPNHSHNVPRYGGSGLPGESINFQPYNYGSPTSPYSTSSAGSDQPHNNMQPYIALNYIIKTFPN